MKKITTIPLSIKNFAVTFILLAVVWILFVTSITDPFGMSFAENPGYFVFSLLLSIIAPLVVALVTAFRSIKFALGVGILVIVCLTIIAASSATDWFDLSIPVMLISAVAAAFGIVLGCVSRLVYSLSKARKN